ncbi:hypothetical protein NPIL_354441, partial [Nephila pilipes]
MLEEKKCQTSKMPNDCYVSPESIKAGVLYHPRKGDVMKKNILRIIPHPSYNSATGSNDIALIELENPIQCSDMPRPVCLPAQNMSEVGNELIIAGWGYSDRKKKI